MFSSSFYHNASNESWVFPLFGMAQSPIVSRAQSIFEATSVGRSLTAMEELECAYQRLDADVL